LLAAILYFPPVLSSEPSAVFSNRFVAPRETLFLAGLDGLAQSTWLRWSDGVPVAIVWILVGGLAFGLLLNRKVSRYPIPMTIVLGAWSFGFAWMRNILGYPRVWSYLLLTAIISASAGLSLAVKGLAGRVGYRQVAVAGAASVLLSVVVGGSLIKQKPLFRNNETVALIDAAQVVDFLATAVRPGDCLEFYSSAYPILDYEFLHRDSKLYTLVDARNAERVGAVSPKPQVDSEDYRADELVARLQAQDAVDPFEPGRKSISMHLGHRDCSRNS
jgi:hypothetical protein